MSDIFRRTLKKAGSRVIEDALKKAICELTGEEYELDIKTIDFPDDGISASSDKVVITLKTYRPLKFFREDQEEANVTSSTPS